MITLSVMLPQKKMRWLNRKGRGALVGISPLVFDQGPSVREKPQIILETKLGGWRWGRGAREHGTSSCMKQETQVTQLCLLPNAGGPGVGVGCSSEGSRPCESWPEKGGGHILQF